MILLVISTGTVFAQESLISELKTDDNNYDEGDTIVISGKVNTVIADTPIIIQIINESTYVHFAQITIAQDGSFSETVLAEGPLWTRSGEYIVKAAYQDTVAETVFVYSPKTEIPETTTNFEVDAGSYGTFDIEYAIKGGTVENMIVDDKNFAIIVKIIPTDEGTITINLPREYIGAEKQDGKDDIFIILIDEKEVAYKETIVHSESRAITINFEQGDSDIKIIGTYVVPEFGAITMMILITGIMITVLFTRNKLRINI